jgi:hypothetical protein
MLALWFYHADESDPTNATISDYIREQHAPGTADSPPAFESVSGLQRAFKARFGKFPRAWRKSG